ncbi:MAG: hypothetical protein K2M99_07410 [Treponemataceae bacterium]|nr:hypothetical protein [Treponemataceae bacterium]
MLSFSSIWILLLGIRECANIFTDSTTVLTVLITIVQFIHLFFLMEKEKWKFTWLHFAFCILVLLTIYNPGALPTTNILLSIILLKKTPIQRVGFVIIIAFFIELFVYLSAFGMGILHDGTKIYLKGLTHDLGFRNSNTPGLQFMMLTLCVAEFFLLTFKIKFPLLLLLLPNYCIYALTLGRTSFYSVCFFFFLMYYFSFRRNYFIERKFAVYLPVILFSVVFFLLYFYRMFPIVNVIFTGRFRINANILGEMSALHYIIGYAVPEGPMDCAYLGVLFNGGILSVILFLSCCCNGISNMPLKNAKIFLPYIIVMLASGFTEGTFSLFRLSTVLFYKMITDQFEFSYISAKYLKLYGGDE